MQQCPCRSSLRPAAMPALRAPWNDGPTDSLCTLLLPHWRWEWRSPTPESLAHFLKPPMRDLPWVNVNIYIYIIIYIHIYIYTHIWMQDDAIIICEDYPPINRGYFTRKGDRTSPQFTPCYTAGSKEPPKGVDHVTQSHVTRCNKQRYVDTPRVMDKKSRNIGPKLFCFLSSRTWIDGSMDRWIDGSMDGWMDGSMDGWMDG